MAVDSLPRLFSLLTYFPHHPQALLVVGPAAPHEDRDLMLLQRTQVVFDGPDDALKGERHKGQV